MDAIKSIGLDNCLSETNLHLSVPSLKSKTRGKVYVCFNEFVCNVFD